MSEWLSEHAWSIAVAVVGLTGWMARLHAMTAQNAKDLEKLCGDVSRKRESFRADIRSELHDHKQWTERMLGEVSSRLRDIQARIDAIADRRHT